MRRYRLVRSDSRPGVYSEFSAGSDDEAVEYAHKCLYGAGIAELIEIEHRADGDRSRTILGPGVSR